MRAPHFPFATPPGMRSCRYSGICAGLSFHLEEKAGRSMRAMFCRQAFTLIEILVVVAIIALLIAILLPSLARARGQARLVLCQSNIKQLEYGFGMYVVENKGRFPGSRKDDEADWLGGSNGSPRIYGASKS